MKRNGRVLRAMGFLFLFAISSELRAQQVSAFEQLQLLVKPGDKVYVTDSTGTTTKGKIADLSSSTLRLIVNGTKRDLAQADVFQDRQWRHDSLGNGTAIGALTGLGFGTVVSVLACANASCSGGDAGILAAFIGISTGVGAGIGLGIDALIPAKQTIFRNTSQNRVSRFKVQPILSKSSKGIRVGMSF